MVLAEGKSHLIYFILLCRETNALSIDKEEIGEKSNKQGGKIMIDAQGNRARVFPDGTFEEL